MPPFDTVFLQLARNILYNGNDLPPLLSELLSKSEAHRYLTLTLESPHGPLLDTGVSHDNSAKNERNIKALPALSEEPKNEKRFFFSMSDTTWEVLSAFTVDAVPYFTTMILDTTGSETAPLRSGLFKLSDYFTVQCRKGLERYINTLVRSQVFSADTSDNFIFEKNILKNIVSFSHDIQCAVLLDEDGFIIHTEGETASVEELGGALARLFYRSNHAIAGLDATECDGITLSDHEYTIEIGRLPGTSLALAISVNGRYASAYAQFLHRCASRVLSTFARQTGMMWGVALAEIKAATRVRESWFSPPHLVPYGKFVAKNGGKSFHIAACQILAKTDATHLQWFDNRASAIQSGLRPCNACNP